MAGDSEANVAYYCLHKLHILPKQYMELSEEEKAFIIAAIQIKVKKEKENRK